MRSFVCVLLFSKVGFICHEAVTSLKLLEKGFSREDLALSVLLDFPLQIFFGYYAAKWSNGQRPLKPVSKCTCGKWYNNNSLVVVVCFLWQIGMCRFGYAYC